MKKRKLVFALIVAAVGGILCSVPRALLLIRHFNPQSGYYDSGDPGMLPVIMRVLLLAVAACAVFLAVSIPKKAAEGLELSREGKVYAISVICETFAMAAVTASGVLGYIRYTARSTISICITALALVCVLYSFYSLTAGRKAGKRMSALMGLVPAAVFLLVSFRLYFAENVIMNSPNKAAFTAAAVGFALSRIYAAEMDAGIGRSRLFAAVSCVSVALTLYCCVSDLAYFISKGSGAVVGAEYDAALIVLAVSCACRMLSLDKKKEEPETADAAQETADDTAEEEPRFTG